MNQKIKILVADDSRLIRALLNEILIKEGFDVVLVNDGLEAVEAFKKEQPDLVILDIMMPNLDGIGACELIQKELQDEYVPIVFITGDESEKNLQRCLDVGGDDFINKPFKSIALVAKINSLIRVRVLYKKQLEQKQALLAFQTQTLEEEEVAANLNDNIINADFFKLAELRYLVSPAALFNGDILLVCKTPANHLNILLGDFTGHGLLASIGASPAAEIFYGMTHKGYDINEIIVEINQKMCNILPVNKFLAVTMLTLYPDTNMLKIIPCGLPDHYLYNKKTQELNLVMSNNLPLGILKDFEPVHKIFTITDDDYLYLFTDGVIEAENKQGEQFDCPNVIDCITNKDDAYMALIEGLNEHTGNVQQQDDITWAELHCKTNDIDWIGSSYDAGKEALPVEALTWKTSFDFNIDTLRKINPVPIVVNNIMEIQSLQAHREDIFLIVTELFSNALEHGILSLDSNLKVTADGFMDYYKEREERLASFTEGALKISLSHEVTAVGGKLLIRVQDSGKGFDITKINNNIMSSNMNNFGRGIQLLKTLCSSVEYSGDGNKVKAVYDWTF